MIENLSIQNTWWQSGKVSSNKLGKFKKNDFEKLRHELGNEKISCLLGARRTGKTTLMFQLIDSLLQQDVPAKRILYVSFDNAKIRLLIKQDFDKLLNEFSEFIGEPLEKLSQPIYIFYDEIQKLENWSDNIKYWQDLGLKIKFIISGSSATRLIKGIGESLLGRIKFTLSLPLQFSEFLTLKGVNFKINSYDLFDFDSIKSAYHQLLPNKNELIILLNDYFLRGGYPEVTNLTDIAEAYEMLRISKTLIVNRDILELRQIKESRTLSDLVELLSDYMARRINYTNFASLLKVKLDTIKNFISYLEDAFLVYCTYAYSKSQIMSTRKDKKLYFIDHGLRNALLLKKIDELEKSRLAENIVFQNILYSLKNEITPKIFYWLDKNHREVDFVFWHQNRLLPIEVKYRETIDKNNHKPLLNFIAEHHLDRGFMVTKNLLEEKILEDINAKLVMIPLWLYLLK